ncbi:MAG: alpha/beta hydrolase [Deltaproteobacteria bacterium]|nr:MAG: alpha/beta hydrolase [Deltaproteobacteria bacterium]
MKTRKKWRHSLLLGCILLLAMVCVGQAASYDYPFADPIEATILSTPKSARAKLPEKIRVKEYATITVFPERHVPEVFWYNKELRYSIAYHKEKAPLMVLIAGTGAGYDSAKMQMMQKAFFQAGFHVLALSSPTHPNFIVAASSTGMPGDIRSDAKDIYHVLETLWQRLSKKELVSNFYLTGYSLGGSEAAFVAKLDEERKVFNFKKVLMINPALNIYDSAVKLDKMLVDNIPGGIDHFDDFYQKLIHNITKSYVHGDFVDLAGDFFYKAYDKIIPNPQEGKALIGFSFRISLANMLFTADVMTNSGYLVPKNLKLSRTTSLTNYCKVASRGNGFREYAENLLYPYFRRQNPYLSFQALIARSSLRSIESYLRNSDKIGLVTNVDDIILADGDIDYFKQVFGSRAKIYPRGGHCGNMAYKDNVRYMVNFFKSN